MSAQSGRLPLIVLLLCLSFLLASSSRAQQTTLKISTPEEFKTEFEAVPCKNGERQDAVKALFIRMGAPPAEISVQKFKSVENVVLIKNGESAEKIIIGAHYDKVSAGCGAVDNWTGVVTLAHLYRSLMTLPTKKTLIFVAFGNEEKGLVGSRAMVESISKNQVSEYCAMINIDSLGLGNPRVADDLSNKQLVELTAQLAAKMKLQFYHASIGDASADSVPFLQMKIPAVTIDGLTNGWGTILHSENDKPKMVNPLSVYLGYRLALALADSIGNAACASYR